MITKSPKPSFIKFIKKSATILFVGEALVFAVSYGLWYQVNTKRDLRKYLNDNYPTILDYYYTVGEKIDSESRIRQIDYAYWQAEKPQQH